MMLQVTVYAKADYKPISALVEMPIKDIVAKNYKPYVDKGIEKICVKRRWTKNDMIKKWGYTTVKYRPYDPQKIEQENKERYEKIKKERGWA